MNNIVVIEPIKIQNILLCPAPFHHTIELGWDEKYSRDIWRKLIKKGCYYKDLYSDSILCD